VSVGCRRVDFEFFGCGRDSLGSLERLPEPMMS
jgi:hypothetical protein